jgi:hypothetical protein
MTLVIPSTNPAPYVPPAAFDDDGLGKLSPWEWVAQHHNLK